MIAVKKIFCKFSIFHCFTEKRIYYVQLLNPLTIKIPPPASYCRVNLCRQPELGDKKSAFATDLLHCCEHTVPLLHALNSLLWNVGLRDNKCLTLLFWCYANQNTHPSPGLYLALPLSHYPKIVRGPEIHLALEERWCGHPISKRTEGGQV